MRLNPVPALVFTSFIMASAVLQAAPHQHGESARDERFQSIEAREPVPQERIGPRDLMPEERVGSRIYVPPREHDWHGDIHQFHQVDRDHWENGRWHRGVHDGHEGWWWVVDVPAVPYPLWYSYPEPMYPYPDPYIPGAAVVPRVPPAPPTVWYFCRSSSRYYPYVSVCPEGWVSVPATAP